MKEIPKKNYIILVIIFAATVLLTFYVRSWYITTKQYYAENSVIKDIVSEINQNEIGNYTIESQKFVLYVSSGRDQEIKKFENDFKKLIQKLDISADILYLNLDNVDINSFNATLKENFAINKNISTQISDTSSSTIYIFENGKIVSVMNNVKDISVKRIETYLQKWSIKND